MKKYLKSFKSYTFLLSELVKRGIRLKYRRSYLGILWSLAEPLMTTIVLVIVFGTLFGRSREFPLYVMSGKLLYGFFSAATKSGCKSVRRNASMIKKVYVAKYLYPLSSVLFNFIIFAISLLVIIPVCIYCGIFPQLQYVWQLIPGLLNLLILTLGVSVVLATLNVFFRDIEYLWNVLLMIIMYLCAIFYPVERLMDSGWAWLLNLNPLYGCIDMFRGALIGYQVEFYYFAYSFIFGVVTLIIGLVFFKAKQDEFILHL
ncbi:MAG: ABC transporter permease [Lachnospiraceae bacterium]|nr:ABC transporter permease [Lachnospiraceae bacterium]